MQAAPPKPEAYVPPPSEAPRKTIVALNFLQPFVWLRKGAADLIAHPGIAAFYGLSFCAMAGVLAAVFRSKPE